MKKFLLGMGIFILGLTLGVSTMAQGLTDKQEALVPIAAFAAKGDEANLAKAINAGLDAGLTLNQIKEVLIQLYAYAGFPRSLSALNTMMTVENERKAKGIKDPEGEQPKTLPKDADKGAIGEKVQTGLVGHKVGGPLFDYAPIINDFLKQHLFCDIFTRGVLTDQERELATVGILASLPAPSQLESHLNICRNVGLTREQMESYVRTLADKVGKPEAELAGPLVNKVFDVKK